MWWRWLIVVLACLDAISSQPLTQQVSDGLRPIECCPCPGSERAALDALGSTSQPTESGLNRETDVDDCPCRDLAGDSDGAPSLLLPRVLRPLRPDVKPEDKNEDIKPLLHPEVDLASSVLETLRDVTEEEYQEALARDAARNAARASDDGPRHQVTDPVNTDIVTIIVNPKAGEEEDIIISEASNIQESKCAQPFGSSGKDLSKVRSTTPLLPSKGLLRLSKIDPKNFSRRPFNMQNSASNVEGRVVSTNRGLESLKLKSSPSKLSEFLERSKSQILDTSNIDETKKDFISPKVPNFRFDSLLKKKNEQTGPKANVKNLRVNPVDHHIFPKISLDGGKTTILDSMSDLDSSTSPSNDHEIISESLTQKPQKFNLKSFVVKDVKKRPTHLKNILKLRDIELIPNKPMKTKISNPSFKLLSFSSNVKDNNEPPLTETSYGQERRLKTQEILQNSERAVNKLKDSDFSPSEYLSTFIETERNISEEHISDDVTDSELSTIQGDIDDSNRSGEAHEDFEDFILDSGNENFEINEEEQESSEREASSFSTEINKESNELEIIDHIELPREDKLQNEDDDSLVDASNNDFRFISQGNDHTMEFPEKKIGKRPEEYNEATKMEPTRNNAVTTIKEKMLHKLEDLKDDIAQINNVKPTYSKFAEITDVPQNATERDDFDEQTDTTNLDLTIQEFIPTTRVNDQISSFDHTEENSENLPISSEASSQGWKVTVESSEIMRENDEENSDMNPSASSPETIILDSVSLPSDSKENSSNQDIMNDQVNSNENLLEKTCLADMNKNVEIKVQDATPKEMSSSASESVPNIVAQPSERQSIIVQPTSLFGDNSLFRPLPSLLNLDGHLPTLDEIRSGLSGILGIGARGADDDEISAEFQSAEDCSSLMSTGASTISSKSIFPTIRPIEDMNLDIFQLTPKSQKGLFQSQVPGLNLNSYKAKLALPQNLGLKPLRLESSLGKNGNLLGATLTFGPEKIGSTRPKTSRTSSILDNARVPTLRSSLSSLHLDDIKTTMRARAEDILSPPLSKVPSHTVQKVSKLTDNLRSQTENTMKNIQQTLASSLTESRVRDIPLREKFAKPSPEDLLEKLSSAREDMSDKLKALHADLADRLSSIHENIAERTTLPTLQLPLLTPINRNLNPKFRTRPKSYSKPKASVSNMRSSSASRRNGNEIKVRPFKISKAASTLTPKTVEVPKLMVTSSKPPFAKSFQRDSNVKIKDNTHFESSMAVEKKSLSTNNFRASENNPSSQSKPSLRQQFASQRTASRAPSTKDTFRNRVVGSKSRLHDSRGFASELQPARVPAPVKSEVTVTERVDPIQTQIFRSRPKPPFSNKNLGILNQMTTPATKSSNDQVSSLIHKPIPNIGNSSLLSKMRESLLSRHTSNVGSPINNADMARSATENRPTEVIQEPLKENVKYRCRMVCVKEPIE